MKKKNKQQKSKVLDDPLRKIQKTFYSILLIILALTALIYLGFTLRSSVSISTENTSGNEQIKFENKQEFIPLNVALDYLINIRDEKVASIQVSIAKKEKEAKVSKIEALLQRYNSPMQGYGQLIYDRATECGGDYRIIVGIAGNESGFGRVPLKKYNPFGYLDGVQYSGWDESLNYLSCKIAQKFLKPCNNNLTCIVNKYGGSDTPKERWVNNVQYFVNQL